MGLLKSHPDMTGRFSLVPDAQPGQEPVSVEEARLFLRVDGTAEDDIIHTLITAARVLIEASAGLAMMNQTWTLWLDRWPGPVVILPRGPVRQVVEIVLRDKAGQTTPVPADIWTAEAPVGERVCLAGGAFWPAPKRPDAGIGIRHVLGYGEQPADVPAPLRQAILMLVAHWYENREAVAMAPATELPQGVAALVAPWREMRL